LIQPSRPRFGGVFFCPFFTVTTLFRKDKQATVERRRALHAHLPPTPGVQIIEHVASRSVIPRDRRWLPRGGIVAKRMDALYRAGKHPSWIKIENQDYSRRSAVEWRSS